MRVITYAGERAFWNVRQAGYAAHRYPGYAPSEDGLRCLQQRWYEFHVEHPPRDADLMSDCNIAWANAAFGTLGGGMKYEKAPA